jgi:RNA polymerase sigma-70 factor, ECF subfamily
MTEQETLARARKGDQVAFGALVQSYQNAIYSLCYRMLGSADQAEDAAQETFLRAYTQLHRYDPERSFKTWIFSIASHYCIDRLRRRRIIWIDIDDEPLAGHPALREHRAGPEESAVQQERATDVQSLLASLPPKDRAAVVMLYWYEFSYQEIADATGTTVSAVKSRLHRARAAMAEAMGHGTVGRDTAPSAGKPAQAPRPMSAPLMPSLAVAFA